MASTDTRSGFRLPWSSDRSHEDPASETAAEAPVEPTDAVAAPTDPGWPAEPPVALDAEGVSQPTPEAAGSANPDAEEPATMVELDPAAAQAPAAPARKPSKLMADLTAAIRSTAEAAREQALAQVDADVTQVVASIREKSTEGAAALKVRSDEDIAGIREWSKAEIARIREETEARISGRKATLEEELAGHAAAVERRVQEVHDEKAQFETAMESYMERLLHEDDPARLATMAETLPESPSFEAWADLDTLDITFVPELDAPEAEVDAEAVAPADAVSDPWAFEREAVAVEPEAILEPAVEADAAVDEPAGPDESYDAATAVAVADAPDPDSAPNGAGWGDSMSAWGGSDTAGEDVPRWSTDDSTNGYAPDASGEAGDPVDRGAIMAALEAAAEAVVAAEAAAESADQAEAAADVAETAAGLLVGRAGGDEELDPEAQAALDARVDAGGFDTESFADRLATLLPYPSDAGSEEEVRTTQVVVTGLVSVASIASFKRHLGRLPGVQNVAVASGPEGEFVFNLTHRADLSFRDAIPTMPGFAARVTSTGDGVVNVTARDPEAEG